MKLLQDLKDAKAERKSLKPQVEKRRRERINRSLESLRTMLLQGSQQLGGTQRRLEKAEILERTVLFLQSTARRDTKMVAAGGGGGGGGAGGGGAAGGAGGGGRAHSFQDGISICLQRAADFLGPEWKGLCVQEADSPSAARFNSPSNSASLQRGTEAPGSSLPHSKSVLQMVRQKSNLSRQRTAQAVGGNSPVRPEPIPPVEQGFPGQPAQSPNQLEIRVERRAAKQSPSQSRPVSQALWRPWP